MAKVTVVGAGIFGVAAALELSRRGHDVTLVDGQSIPAQAAASTDISKAVRAAYGDDVDYTALMERALDGWSRWDAAWRDSGAGALYHAVGSLISTSAPMRPGQFEHDSFELLRARGHRVERLADPDVARRFGAFRREALVDGFFHDLGGYAESGRVVEQLAREASAAGVVVKEGWKASHLRERDGRVLGVTNAEGDTLASDELVVATGCWSARLVPELAPLLRATGHALFHLPLAQQHREAFAGYDHEARRGLPFFSADIATTGLYGFPLHPRAEVVKLALHDAGSEVDPDVPREISAAHRERLDAGVARVFPALAGVAPCATRLCLYADTTDGAFIIDRVPDRAGLSVATGGSGHGFKFAPLLGELVTDVVEGRPPHPRFAWRGPSAELSGEAARCLDA